MLVFNNQQRSGYEELASYGPKFYMRMREMDAIYQFAGFTADCMAFDLEELIALQFIAFMDDEALTRFEKFLSLETDKTKTLDERRLLAFASYSSAGKLSKTKISDIINSFAECVCHIILIGSTIEINMTFKDNPAAYMNNIRQLISKSIPAHISILYKGLLDMDIVFKWVNRVTVLRIINHLTFHLYNYENKQFFNGNYFYDGSIRFSRKFCLFPYSVCNLLCINNVEQIYLTAVFGIGVKNISLLGWGIVTQNIFRNIELVKMSAGNVIAVHHEESTSFALTIKHDEYYFNGEYCFNGRKTFDVYIKEEGL